MSKRLYVGGIAWGTTEEGLKEFFEGSGSVEEATIITDRETGRSRGFGFVTMANDDDAARAIEEFNGKELDGRSLTVNEANERSNNKRRF